jgi:poly-gamma-glutamate capsule biosynthesis protein CapA/YwtB (metallophosphatase superfamily)
MANIEHSHIKLMFGGDVMLGRGVNDMVHKKGHRFPLESLLPVFRQSDLFFVNLECAITPKRLKYSGPFKAFYFRGDPEVAEVLSDAGVNVVSLANNHALDADYQGLQDTLQILKSKNIQCVGAGNNLVEAIRPVIIERGGMTFGIIGCCDHQSDFAATANQPGIWYIDTSSQESINFMLDSIHALNKKVDHVIVAFHWQSNYVHHVEYFHRILAKHMVQAGARIIWGHSPHHIQGVEFIDKSAVLYSTGGLIDDYAHEPYFHNERELLFMVQVNKEGVEEVKAYPIELEFCFTDKAGPDARRWIYGFFSQQCEDVGSKVQEDGEWLRISA